MEVLDQTMQQDIEKVMSTIFLHVLFNWNNIKQNTNVMNCLDMNTNSLCRQLKNNNPTLRDGYIQAHVLSFLIMMAYMMNVTTQKILNCGSNLLGGAIINCAINTLMDESNNTQSLTQPVTPISEEDVLTPMDFVD